MFGVRAIPGIGALALLSGCGASFQHPPLLDAHTYDLTRPGITCMRGLRWDDARGCTRDAGPGETALRIEQRDDMTSIFQLVRALYVLDGRVAHLWNDSGQAAAPGSVQSPDPPVPGSVSGLGAVETPGAPDPGPTGRTDLVARLEPRKEKPILDIAVTPGPHVLQVLLRYRGNGYGVFSYLRGYSFDVRSTHSLVAAPGTRTVVRMMGHENGGVTTPLEERPAVRWLDASP